MRSALKLLTYNSSEEREGRKRKKLCISTVRHSSKKQCLQLYSKDHVNLLRDKVIQFVNILSWVEIYCIFSGLF